MNLIGRYERAISKRPKTFIVMLIAVTVFLSFFASQMDMDSGENDFLPDTEVAKANQIISEKYGSQHNLITVITLATTNVLNQSSLLAQLDLENRINNAETVSAIIQNTSENPSGFSSPARLLAQAHFIATTLAMVDELIKNPQSLGINSDREELQQKLMNKALSLSPEEMKTILAGENITLHLSVSQFITLDFDTYNPNMISDFYTDPIVSSVLPLENILPFLLSDDYNRQTQTASKSLMSIAIDSATSEDISLEAEKEVQKLANAMENDQVTLRVLGDALVSEKVNEASGRNIALLMPLAFGFVILVLVLMYRNISDTLLNLIALVMAILWVYGMGVLLNLNLGNPMMTAVPVLVIGLGIDYGIHYVSRYREEVEKGEGIQDAIVQAGATVGFAILLTTITTVVGFMSNVTSNISAVRDFGILCSLGIFSAFILMITFFPAAKILVDRQRKKKGKKRSQQEKFPQSKKPSIGKKLWSKIGNPEDICPSDIDCPNNGLGLGAIAALVPARVIIVLLVITTASIYGATQLEARYDYRDFLPDGLAVTNTFNMLVEDFNFSQETVYILVEGDVAQPSVFQTIKRVQSSAMSSKYAMGARKPESPYALALSMIDKNLPTYNRSFNTVWNAHIDRNGDGEIDENITKHNVTVVYQAMMDYNSEEAMRVLDLENGEFIGILVRIPVDTKNEEKTAETSHDMEVAAEPFKMESIQRVIITGGPIVSYLTFKSINEGQIQTLLITFLIALAILTLLYFYLHKSLLLGAVTILPLVFVICWTFGTMYFLQIPLNPVTVTIAAITVGLGIDYSIHLTQRFLEDLQRVPKPECALCLSASHTGSALFGSATTTVVGFAILSLAIIPPLAQFGKVSAISIFFAFLAAVFVLPTFLLLWYKAKYK